MRHFNFWRARRSTVSVFASVERCSLPVEGYLRLVADPRKCFFQKNRIFFISPENPSTFGVKGFESNKFTPRN